VIESVHAFASDPSRGLFILIFLAVCVGGALGLYAWRAPLFKSNAGFAAISRESFLLFNNVLLVTATAAVLLGTLYPMFLDALKLGKISVGAPWFTAFFLIPMLPMMFLLAPGMHAEWKRASFGRTKSLLGILFGISIVLAIAVPTIAYGWHSVLTIVGFLVAFWVAGSALIEPIERLRKKHSLSASVVGMCVAHFGLAIFVVGATTVQSYKKETDLSLGVGQSTEVAGYTFTMNKIQNVTGPNYDAVESEIAITRDGKPVGILHPQKRTYRVQTSPMTEAGIDAGWGRDLFVAMGEQIGPNTWSLRLQYKPMVRFIWFGAVVVALGGLIAVCDRRYRQRVPARETAASDSQAKVA
jgi:cytochrome c-type biogenesis protein CcmF